MQTIAQVLEQLESIVSNPKNGRNAWFAAVYLHMTRAVEKGLHSGVFQAPELMERLDIVFAKRYLDALQAWQAGQPCSRCWRVAFDRSKTADLMVLQHIILGMNAHINYDLAIAAATVAPGASIFRLQQDFMKINLLIAHLAGSIQEKLTAIWWPMRLLSNLAQGSEQAVLNFSVSKARDVSWKNAVTLAQLPPAGDEVVMQTMDQAVVEVSNRIVTPPWMTRIIIKQVKWAEEKNIERVTAILKENPS